MESLIAAGIEDIRLVWAAYSVSVLLAYLFLWAFFASFVSHPDIQGLLLWPFWVVLFSVSPVALGNDALAPTSVITLFALDSGDEELLELTWLWWLVGALTAALYFLVLLVGRELWRLYKRKRRKGASGKKAVAPRRTPVK